MPHAHGLGRNPFTRDARDYGPRALKEREAAGLTTPIARKVVSILDQGDDGTCVSAGILGAINCALGKARFTNDDIVPFFLQIPGHGALPEGGAEVRQGLATAKKLGYIDAYALLATKADQDDWIEGHGPAVQGMDWYTSMRSPSSKGYVTVSGSVEGGHCIYGNGDLLLEDDDVNSWGLGWGDDGKFYLTVTNATKIRNGDFESWGFTLPAVPVPVPTPTPVPVPTPPPAVKTTLQVILAALKTVVRALEKLIKSL